MGMFNTVLLIEDNPGDARLVVEYLKERYGENCQVIQVNTLASGLQALRGNVIDIVLLDLGLPDSLGLDGVVSIHAEFPSMPVVILTGDNDDDKALEALRIGAEDYLAKQQADSVTLIRAMRHAVQRKRLGEQVKKNEALYRSLVDTAEEGIFQLSRTGEIMYANRRAALLLGISTPEEADGLVAIVRPFQSFVMPQDLVSVNYLLRIPNGERASCEFQLLRDDAAPCFVVAAAGVIDSLDGRESDLVVLLTDVTGRKLAEGELGRLKDDLEIQVARRTAELQLANAELHAVNRALAHDLRNPLNGILGLTRLVQRDASQHLPEPAQRRLHMVEQTALAMNEMISGLLSLASVGRKTLELQELDLSEMASAITNRLAETDSARQVAVTIQPGIHGTGDRSLVANILQNLLHNAWKYSSNSAHATIEFRCDASETGGVVYSVSDNGIGFDESESSMLFEPYQRLSSSDGFEGNGLGLAGVKRIIERHGGRIWATSIPNQKTTFSFTLGQ